MKLNKNIWYPKSFVLVSIVHSRDGKQFFAGIVNKHIEGDDHALQQFESLEEVIKHFGKNKVYQLNVLGLGVLTRGIDFHSNYVEDLIVSGDPSDFYFTSFHDEFTVVTSFCRKDLLEEDLNMLSEKNILLLDVVIGEISLYSLLESRDIIKTNFHFEITDNRIVNFGKTEKIQSDKATWNGSRYQLQQLVAISLYRSYPEKEEHFISSYQRDTDNTQEIRERQKFNFIGIAGVSIILLALLVNFFYQNSLNNDLAQLEMDLSVSNENLALLDRLEQEKLRKEQLVFSAGVTSTKFLSFYLDEIGAEVPGTIKLQSMEVFPLTGKLKDKHKVEVDQHLIEISGITHDNEVLDDWIERMDRFAWVGEIELMNYLKNERGSADFKLKIQLLG